MVQIMHLRQEYQRGDAMFWLYYIKWHTISVCPLLVTFALVTWLWWCLAAMWSYTFSPSWFKSILQGCTFALSSSPSLHKLWIHSFFSLYQYGLMASHFNQQDTINVCHDSFATKNYFVDFLVGFWVLLTCPHLSLTMPLILVRQKVPSLSVFSSVQSWEPCFSCPGFSVFQPLSSHPRVSSSGASSHLCHSHAVSSALPSFLQSWVSAHHHFPTAWKVFF